MVNIIEHDNYNAPVNNTTIIEGKVANPLRRGTFLTGKFFKVMPNIWIHLESYDFLKEKYPKILGLLDNDYYTTTADKSLYLKRVTIAFKRINSIHTGKNLLEYLSKIIPLNPSCLATKKLIHEDSNIINNKTKLGHPFSILIMPPKGYISSRYILTRSGGIDSLEEFPLIARPGILYYMPDITTAFKVADKIVYSDPAVSLAHELIHGLHSILGINNAHTASHFTDGIAIEEKLTFGGDDLKPLYSKMNTIIETITKNLYFTADVINYSKDTPQIKDKFAEQFFLEKTTSNVSGKNRPGTSKSTSIYKCEPNSGKYIAQKAYFDFNETQISLDFNLPTRGTYGNKAKFFRRINLENTDHYTIERGINLEKIQQMPLHDAFVNFCETIKHISAAQLYKIYNECLFPASRSKRDLQDSKCEPVSRVKRSINCLTIDELALKYKSVTERVDEIPHKFLKNYSSDINLNTNKPKINTSLINSFKNVKVPLFKNLEELKTISPENMDTTPNNIINIGGCITYEIDVVPHTDFIYPKDLLKSRALELPLKKDSPVIIENKDFASCVNCNTMTFTTSEALADKMDLLSKGKAILHTGESVANLYMFGIWLDEVIEDIKGTFPDKDTLHKTNDFLTIVPYIGPALNIAVDIKDHNYVGAAETVGLLGLLVFFPELTFPVMLGGILSYLFNKYKKNPIIYNKVIDYVNQVLVENDYKIDSFFNDQYITLREKVEERVNKIVSLVHEEFLYNVMGTMHNIRYYFKKHNIINDEYSIDDIIRYKHSQLLEEYKHYYQQLKPHIYFFIKDKVIIPFQQQEIKYLSQIQQSTKDLIVNMIKEKYTGISSNFIKDILNKVDKHIEDLNIVGKLKKEINGLEVFIKEELNSYNQILPLIDVKVDTKLARLTDINPNTSYSMIKGMAKKVDNQRCGQALKLTKETVFKIKNNALFNTTLKNDFTIGFWLRVPLISNQNLNATKQYILLDNYNSKEKSGWKITFTNRKLEFCYYKKDNNSFNVLVRLKIADNLNYSWNYITIINYSKSYTLEACVNHHESNIFKYNKQILEKIFVNVGDSVIYQNMDLTIYTGGFQYYDSIEKANNKNPYEFLGIYDYYGNPIKTNTHYALILIQKDPRDPNKLIYYTPYEDELLSFCTETMDNYITKTSKFPPPNWIQIYSPMNVSKEVNSLVLDGEEIIMSFGNELNTFYASNTATHEVFKTTSGGQQTLYTRKLSYDNVSKDAQKVEVILSKHELYTHTIDNMKVDNVITIKMVPTNKFKDSRFIAGNIFNTDETVEIRLAEFKEGKIPNLESYSQFFVLFPLNNNYHE